MASLPALGGIGLLFAAFIDSSFVPLPLVTDLILFDLSSLHPMRMPFYAAMAALGSVAGCLWIYYLARKGGQVYYRKTQGHRSEEHTSELQSHSDLVCRLLLEKKKNIVPRSGNK